MVAVMMMMMMMMNQKRVLTYYFSFMGVFFCICVLLIHMCTIDFSISHRAPSTLRKWESGTTYLCYTYKAVLCFSAAVMRGIINILSSSSSMLFPRWARSIEFSPHDGADDDRHANIHTNWWCVSAAEVKNQPYVHLLVSMQFYCRVKLQ